MPGDQRPARMAGMGYAEHLILQRRLLEQMHVVQAQLDPQILQAYLRDDAVPTDRAGIERTVVLFLAARKDARMVSA